MKSIQLLVEMFTDSSFIQDYWMQKPKVFQAEELFKRARTEHSLEILIEAAVRSVPDAIHIVEKYGSRQVDGNAIFSGDEDPTTKILNIAHKRTLVLYDFHIIHRFYRELARQLEEKFWGDVTAGMFVSLNKRAGFKKHYDRSHIFVFQHTGSTVWKIYDFMKDRKLILEHELMPGEILYVPIFYTHTARRVGNRESHVSVGINYDQTRNFYEALLENPVLIPAWDEEGKMALREAREKERQRNLADMDGPHRTWICKSGEHQGVIPADSMLALIWAAQQENGLHGPLDYGDVSCVFCNPTSDPGFTTVDPGN